MFEPTLFIKITNKFSNPEGKQYTCRPDISCPKLKNRFIFYIRGVVRGWG